MRRPSSLIPILALLGGASLGASSGLFIKSINIPSLALTGFRMGVPFLFLLPIMIRGKRLLGEPGSRKLLWLTSAVNAIRMLLFVTAYKRISVGNAVVLLYLWPIFALLFDAIRQRRRPTPGQLGLLCLSVAGVIVMNLHRGLSLSGDEILGSLLMISSAALYALTAIIFKQVLRTARETDALYFQNAVGALIFIPFAVAGSAGATAADVLIGLCYGLTVGLTGFFLFFFSMKRLPLFQYSALAYAEVVIGVLLGVFVLGESLVLNQIAGAIMVVAASFLAQRARSAGA